MAGKWTYASRTFKSRTFASGTWAGVGSAAAPPPPRIGIVPNRDKDGVFDDRKVTGIVVRVNR